MLLLGFSRTVAITLGLKPAPPITLASSLCCTLEETLILYYLKSSDLEPGSQGEAFLSGGARTKADVVAAC